MSNEETIALLLNASNAYSAIAPKADSHKTREQLLRLALSFLNYARRLRIGEIVIPHSLDASLTEELEEAISSCTEPLPLDFNRAVVEGNQVATLLSDRTRSNANQANEFLASAATLHKASPFPGFPPLWPPGDPQWPVPPNWPPIWNWPPRPPVWPPGWPPIGPFPPQPIDPEDPIYREVKDWLRQRELQALIERSRLRYR